MWLMRRAGPNYIWAKSTRTNIVRILLSQNCVLNIYMAYTPPGENIIETKKCRLSGEEFVVTDKDLEFYDRVSPVFWGKKYSLPSPTLCPDERQRRRLMFLNARNLYYGKSDLSGKTIVSRFSPEKPHTVYHFEEWFDQSWNTGQYARDMSFDRPVFEQFWELYHEFPLRNIIRSMTSQNCEFVNGVGGSKDCYLISETTNATNCYYSDKVNHCTDCTDSSYLNHCELCYNCKDSMHLYNCIGCENCSSCRDSIGLGDCSNCTNCMFSENLQGKSFYINNQSFSKSEYKEMKKKFLDAWKATWDYEKQKPNLSDDEKIVPALRNSQVENVSWDELVNCNNCYDCYGCRESEDCKYCYDLINDARSCHDVFCVGNHIENVYESLTINKKCYQIALCNDAWSNCSHLTYCCTSKNSKNLFLCTGMVGKEYCILNKPYSKQEYGTLAGKIADHMISTGEWGEFFPHQYSLHDYNETLAQDFYPLTKQEVLNRGWTWRDDDETSSFHWDHYKPLSIEQYNEGVIWEKVARRNIESCLNGILKCEVTSKPFKIIRQELVFYIQQWIPLPSRCPDHRHEDRTRSRNPRKLIDRTCSKCGEGIRTRYSEKRPEKVFCETCYSSAIY